MQDNAITLWAAKLCSLPVGTQCPCSLKHDGEHYGLHKKCIASRACKPLATYSRHMMVFKTRSLAAWSFWVCRNRRESQKCPYAAETPLMRLNKGKSVWLYVLLGRKKGHATSGMRWGEAIRGPVSTQSHRAVPRVLRSPRCRLLNPQLYVHVRLPHNTELHRAMSPVAASAPLTDVMSPGPQVLRQASGRTMPALRHLPQRALPAPLREP